MEKGAVRKQGVRVALVWPTFSIRKTCYRYERKLSNENAVIADWLVRLTTNRRI